MMRSAQNCKVVALVRITYTFNLKWVWCILNYVDSHLTDTSAVCSVFSFSDVQDDRDGVWNVVAFLLAFVCCVFQVNIVSFFKTCSRQRNLLLLRCDWSLLCPQCHLYLFHSSLKKHKSLTLLSVIVLCNLYLLGLRNVWQLIFHISVASLSTLLINTRKLQDRTGDCGVWGAVGSLLLCTSHSSGWEWWGVMKMFLTKDIHTFCVIMGKL